MNTDNNGPLEDEHLRPEGTWYNTYLGSADSMFVPHWLQYEIGTYLDIPPFQNIPASWWTEKQVKYDIAIGLSTDISNQKEFELLAGILSGEDQDYDEEGERLRDEVGDAAERYAKWVRKTFFQKLKQANEDRDVCVLCEVSKRLTESDVCASCRRDYAKEEQRIRIHLYRAKKAGTPATLTLGQWVSTLKRYHFHCAYCTTRPFEVLEHFIPITSGGGTTEENCVPACRPCNSKKRDEHPEK